MWNDAASTFADKTGMAFSVTLWVSVVSFLLVLLILVVAIWKFHHKKNSNPSTVEGSVTLEILWTVIPTLIVLVMFWFGYRAYLDFRNTPEDAMQVKVFAGKWHWKYVYEDGLEQTGEQGLTIPVNTPVSLELISNDVVHAFYVPAFRIKMDVMPKPRGQANNTMWFEATKEGEFDIFCAEYCGVEHAQMLSKVKVLSEDDYEDWYEEAEEEALTSNLPPGEKVYKGKGCFACHSTDGTKGVGPSFRSIYGTVETVLIGGVEKQQMVDSSYIIRSIEKPNVEVVKGYVPAMPVFELSQDEKQAIVDFIRELK